MLATTPLSRSLLALACVIAFASHASSQSRVVHLDAIPSASPLTIQRLADIPLAPPPRADFRVAAKSPTYPSTQSTPLKASPFVELNQLELTELKPVSNPSKAYRSRTREKSVEPPQATPEPTAEEIPIDLEGIKALKDTPVSTPRPVLTKPKSPVAELWWKSFLKDSILSRETVPISSNSLAIETLKHSPQVSVLAARPQAAKTAIVEQTALFDWSAFVESRWRDSTEPIGSSLTTGGPNIYRDHQFTNEAGLRKTNRLGGQLSVGQQFGLQRSNSQFFSPTDQGTSTLTIDYSQPLLRGAGRMINESTIVLAQLASDSADMEFVARVQDFLTEVNRNYWELYFARAALLIERRLYNRAGKTIDILRKREKVDASKEMIARAESSLATRKTRLIEARRRVLDQQTLLRNIVNSPALDLPSRREFLPTDAPRIHNVQISVDEAFTTAMANRPEVARSLRDIRAASVRYKVSENELLPELNLVMQTYAKGLRGNYDLRNAFDDMFDVSEPAYSAGLMFEVPIGRRAANARLTRRQIELGELTGQFKVEVERILFDVITELRQLSTTRQTLKSNREALDAGTNTLNLLETRYKLLSREEDGSASLRIQDILNSHVRVADAEIAFVRSEIDHALALIRLRRALGTLVRPVGH